MTLRVAVLAIAAFIAWGLKHHHAEARAEDLSWILGPTSHLTGAVTGATFVLQPGEGYFSREHLFVIAKECAGVNFMVAAFVMLTIMLLHLVESPASTLKVLVASVAASYAAAVLVNTTRIVAAMWLAAHPGLVGGVSQAEAHRMEGIAVYFGGLVLLYELVRRIDRRDAAQVPPATHPGSRVARAFRRTALALAAYYSVTLAIPIAGGARSAVFLQHALAVVLVPLLLVLAACAVSAALPARTGRPPAGPLGVID